VTSLLSVRLRTGQASKEQPIFPGDMLTYGLIGTPDTIRKRVAAYEAAGVQELVLWFPDAAQLDSLRWFASEFIL
jgi:hypothetical protein